MLALPTKTPLLRPVKESVTVHYTSLQTPSLFLSSLLQYCSCLERDILTSLEILEIFPGQLHSHLDLTEFSLNKQIFSVYGSPSFFFKLIFHAIIFFMNSVVDHPFSFINFMQFWVYIMSIYFQFRTSSTLFHVRSQLC